MAGKLSFALLCLLGLVRQAHAQEVIIAREEGPQFPRAEAVNHSQVKTETHVDKGTALQLTNPKSPEKKVLPAASNTVQVSKPERAAAAQPSKSEDSSSQAIKVSAAITPSSKAAMAAVTPLSTVSTAGRSPSQSLKPELHGDQIGKTASVNRPVQKQGAIPATPLPLSARNHSLGAVSFQPATNHFETAFVKLADGFDFPVGKPDAQGYYKARGFRSHGHLGEDWDGVRGGDTDLGDPIYSIGHGLVVFARDCHMGWGNVIIVRHSYRENGVVKNIDALYGHLNTMLVHRGQTVMRGQKIATMGTAHGLYDAHLHLEVRKNIEVGMSRSAFAQDFSNYYDPSQFILAHRQLSTNGGTYRVAMNTFVRDAHINFDKARNYSYSRSRGGTSESAAALKKAIASQH